MKSERFTTIEEIFTLGKGIKVHLIGRIAKDTVNAAYRVNLREGNVEIILSDEAATGFKIPFGKVIYDVNEDKEAQGIYTVTAIMHDVMSKTNEKGEIQDFSLRFSYIIAEKDKVIPEMSLKDLLGINLFSINNFKIYLKNCVLCRFFGFGFVEFFLQKTDKDLSFRVLKPAEDDKFNEIYKIHINLQEMKCDRFNNILDKVLDNIYEMFTESRIKKDDIICDYGKDTNFNQTMKVYI